MRILTLLLPLLFSSAAFAQHTLNVQVTDHESGDLLPGVTVYLPELERGSVTGPDGIALIGDLPAGPLRIRISYVGYETVFITKTLPLPGDEVVEVELHHDEEMLESIEVRSTRSSRTIEDSPTRVEFIAGEELSEKGNMKPGDIRMLLNESTGIQTQQTSATSYNSSIRIQGLDGRYTQLLRDGLPLYSGFSGGLSLMQIAPLDLKQVEVIKGSSSTLYGGGAIAGLVNLITKSPEEERELSMMLNGTSALGLDASAFYSEKYGKIGATVFTSYNSGTAYDPADIGLTAIPEFDRFTLNPRLFFYLGDTEINAGVNLVMEDRLGGSLDYIDGDRPGNLYFERNVTDRVSTQFQLEHRFNENLFLTVKNSTNYFDRSVQVPDFRFAGQQFSTFSEANLQWVQDESEWIGGVNLWTDRFDQTDGSAQPLDFSDVTFGTFVQHTRTLDELFTLEAGFRLDAHSEYGIFPLPRVSVLIEPGEQLTMRVGGGLGYKVPTAFTEEAERRQFQGILPPNPDALSAERSIGGNYDINYRFLIGNELSLSTNVLFFYTRVNDPVMMQRIAQLPGGDPQSDLFSFTQPAGFVDTRGVEVNMKWSYRDLKLFIGYTHANVQEHYDGQVTDFPLVAEHRLNNVLMYEKHGDFWIGLEAYYFSPQQLSDGSTGQAYWIAGLMTEKRVMDGFSVFLNFENFLDTRQTAFDTIFTGTVTNPDFREIYAPVDGFVINGGVKWEF